MLRAVQHSQTLEEGEEAKVQLAEEVKEEAKVAEPAIEQIDSSSVPEQQQNEVLKTSLLEDEEEVPAADLQQYLAEASHVPMDIDALEGKMPLSEMIAVLTQQVPDTMEEEQADELLGKLEQISEMLVEVTA